MVVTLFFLSLLLFTTGCCSETSGCRSLLEFEFRFWSSSDSCAWEWGQSTWGSFWTSSKRTGSDESGKSSNSSSMESNHLNSSGSLSGSSGGDNWIQFFRSIGFVLLIFKIDSEVHARKTFLLKFYNPEASSHRSKELFINYVCQQDLYFVEENSWDNGWSICRMLMTVQRISYFRPIRIAQHRCEQGWMTMFFNHSHGFIIVSLEMSCTSCER